MSTRTHHNSPKKNHFIGAGQAGQPLTKAAKELSIPKQTASDIWQKFNKTGSTHTHPWSGCPPKITNRIKRAVIRDAKSNCHKHLDQIRNSMEPRISASTVRKILDEVGMHQRKARKVVYLKQTQKRSQVHWAKDHKDWGSDDWEQVIWSDESYVYIGDDKETVWLPGELMKNMNRIVSSQNSRSRPFG